MGKASICEKTGLKRGTWTAEEDKLLSDYIKRYGIWNWRELPKYAGLSRCGKSCRLRWMNYLQPDVKRGNYTNEEDELIIEMHEKLGNRWAKIAASLPGRTDNELKNRWHTHLKNGLNSKVLSKRGRRKKEGIPAWRDKKWKICSDESRAVAPIILESSGIFPELTEKSNENSSTDSEISKVSEKGNEINSSSSEEGSDISEVAEKGNDISSPSSLTGDSENFKVSEEESVDSIFDEILQFSCNALDWEWLENSLYCYDPMPEVPIFPQVEVGYYSDFYHCEDGMDFSFNN